MYHKKFLQEIIQESEKHPVLDVGYYRHSHFSDYIDYITMEEVTSPIMRGVDHYGRKFIVLKLLIDGKIVLQTVFQRYIDMDYYWKSCGNHSPNPLLFNTIGCGISNTDLSILLSVMRGKTVRITEDPNIIWSSSLVDIYIGKDVYLFDQKKWDATKLIQKNWRMCRYNPNYKMCKSVQDRNMEDIYKECGKVLS